MATKNTNQYDVPGVPTFSTGTAAKPSTPQPVGVSATMPANPNFNPVYQAGNVPANFTGTYRTPEGQDVTLDQGQPTEPQVNTPQPSPQSVQVNAPNAALPTGGFDYNTGKPLAPGQVQSQFNTQTGQKIGQDLSQQYKAGVANAKASGAPAPSSQGAANSAVAKNLPKSTEEYQPVPEVQSEMDKAISTYTQAVAQFLNPDTQRKSLLDDYKTLSASLGISGLQSELMDVNRIMNGTEDDIRSEVTAASGFATESQVQAMTLSRNKNLLKKAQYISDQLTAAKDQLGVMSQLNAQDRQFTEQRMTQGISMLGNIVQLQQTMHKAAQDNYNAVVAKQGYDGLLAATGGNPYNISLAEKTLGLQPGGLSQLAQLDAKKRTQAETENNLDTKLKNAQIANINSEIEARNKTTPSVYGTIDNKPQTAAQSAANSYANRMNESAAVIDALGNKFTGSLSLGGWLPNALQSGDRQAYEQAKKNFVTAVLRRESGASISPSEFKTAEEQYFPQAGDKKATLELKEKTRNTVINNFYREANVNRPVLPGMVIESNGKKYKVGMDGETLTEI